MLFRFDDMETHYASLLDACVIDQHSIPMIDSVAKRLISHKDTYKELEKITTVPWSVSAVIHEREASGNFHCHLHNGDPLTHRTVHVPKGRPKTGNPPFTWIESAADALALDHLTDVTDWCMEHACFMWETYNGWAYWQWHHINTPYDWARTNQYQSGKYVADHKYNSSYVDTQIGCVPLIMRMAALDPDAALPRFADRKPHPIVPLPSAAVNHPAITPALPSGGSLSIHSQAPHPDAQVSAGSWLTMWKRVVDFLEAPAHI